MERDGAIAERVSRAIQTQIFPGCVIGIVQEGKRTILPFGKQTYESDAPAVVENTIYDVASITKSIPTASLALLAIAQGRLSLDTPVRDHVPELQNDFGATVEDLLRYRVKGPRLSDLRFATFEQLRTHILEQGFDGPPASYTYTNLPAYILGLIVERALGGILPALAQRYFFDPLEMRDTTFFPHDTERTAPTEMIDGEEIRGIVHDESARIFARARRAVGHAGLFSTAPDVLNFLQALLRGELPAVCEGAQKGLGWQLNETWKANKYGERTFGKTGFTGTNVVCNIQRGIAFTILSNRTYPQRPENMDAINAFRADIADIIFANQV